MHTYKKKKIHITYICMWKERERGSTKNLGDVFETFVDPFHLGCHGGSKTNATDVSRNGTIWGSKRQ
jgi:hypothetical protein